jgi:hypothetical integral membrane protein (TIGR02206 family)
MADCLAFLILGAFVVDPLVGLARGDLDLATGLPLQLCDMAGFAVIWALHSRRQVPFEMAYYWGLSGTFQALLTPSLEEPCLSPDTIRYFVLHSGIVAAVLYLGPGLGMRPRRGGPWRALGWTAALTAIIGPIDWLTGGNYMWLREKPPGSVLDLLGPWPWYILGAGAVGLALFWLVDLPYRLRRPGGASPPTAGTR